MKDNKGTKYKFKEEETQGKSLCCRKGSIPSSPYCVFQTKSVRGGWVQNKWLKKI